MGEKQALRGQAVGGADNADLMGNEAPFLMTQELLEEVKKYSNSQVNRDYEQYSNNNQRVNSNDYQHNQMMNMLAAQ